MKIIYKYPVDLGLSFLNLPVAAKFLHFGVQNGVMQVWFEVPQSWGELEQRVFQVLGTGYPFSTEGGTFHLMTAFENNGQFVWHLYEKQV